MKRANGTGSVVKLRGNRRKPYAAKASFRDLNGDVVQKVIVYCATAREAQTALEEFNASKASGVPLTPDKLAMTVQDVYTLWSDRKFAKAGDASIKSYKASWARLSVIGGSKIRDVSIEQLQSIIDSDEVAGLSKSSIDNDRMLMKALFKFALERDIISKDYSAFVELPTVKAKHEKGAFTDIQVKMLEQMAASNVPWADTALILCYTGFRISELLDLTRFSYNAAESCLTGGMKSEAGKNRIIPIHPKIEPYIKSRALQGGERIVCDNDGAPISAQKYRNYMFKPLAESIGADGATPHWCRHTFATRLHAAGVRELERKRLLGHSDKDVTEHYTHTDLAQLTAAIGMLA